MSTLDEFTAVDDGLHPPSSDFYETETYWYSFFVPDRAIGGWLYTSLRGTAGTCAGGAWIWDDRAIEPWRIPFFEQYSWLRYGEQPDGPARLNFPTGMRVDVREPLMSYDVGYTDRDRLEVALRFDALERPVPLRSGTPPYPKAHHFDQTGHVTGTDPTRRRDTRCRLLRNARPLVGPSHRTRLYTHRLRVGRRARHHVSHVLTAERFE